ncbi:tetratricopeptide repeat protein [Micromonospora sp. KC213]|uniref:tetratricopeptide repeat protein n=1 Tax=Micromonospora sp. KC213 TaxID=2530378 RepID=UPI00105308B9|nr:tetratricopeptide repeat protein [Micromonospora sp. KC213]TDC38051.1 tetratricopeptide repeat protein [Micromonospora sp. KC213]
MKIDPFPVGYHGELLTMLTTLWVSRGRPSLRSIAKKSHVSLGWVSEVMGGRKIPSGDVAVAIAKALGANADQQRRARAHADTAAEVERSIRRHAATQRTPRQTAQAVEHRQLSPAATGDMRQETERAWTKPSAPDTSMLPTPVQVEPVPLWRVQHFTSPAFVGRHDVVTRLRRRPDTGRDALIGHSITGLGGVGKSEVAARYAVTYRDEYPAGVWWLAADGRAAMDAGLASFARRLTQACRDLPDEAAADWARQWLQHWPGWLLILDDVTDPEDVVQLLADLAGASGGHVLVTTRRDVAWDVIGLTPVPLDVLSLADSADLLLERTGQRDRAAAEGIAGELGCLPLALEQAAAHMRHHVMTLDRYLGQLRRQPEQLHAAVTPPHSAERAVARVWDLTLDALWTVDERATLLLGVLAWLAPQDIPRDLVGILVDDDVAADQLLGRLASYSMVGLGQDAINVHALVQAVVRAEVCQQGPPEGSNPAYETAVRLLAEAMPGDPFRDHTIWPRFRRLLPHIAAVAANRPGPTAADGLVGLLLNEAGAFEITQGHYQQARGLLAQAAAVTEAATGESRELAIRLGNLAHTHYVLNELDEAAQLQQRALHITETTVGPDHPDLVIRLGNLGVIEFAAGRPAAALVLHERALAIAEAPADPDPYLVARVLLNISVSLRSLGRPAEASVAVERALACYATMRPADAADLPETLVALAAEQTAQDPESPDVADVLGEFAAAYRAMGRPAQALPIEQRALAIAESALDADHPDLARRLSQLGVTHAELGRPAEAVPLFKRALDATAPDSPELATRLGNLAAAQLTLKHTAEATALLERAVATAERTDGADHRDVGRLLNNLATAYDREGREVEALTLRRRALRIAEDRCEPDHPDLATALGNLAKSLRTRGQSDEALVLQRRALRIAKKAYGEHHPSVADCLEGLALSYLELHSYPAAMQLSQRSVAIRRATLGPDHPSLAHPLITVAVLCSTENPDQALDMLEHAARILEAAFGPHHPDIASPLEIAADLYRRVGRHAAADAVVRRLAELPGQRPVRHSGIGTVWSSQQQ